MNSTVFRVLAEVRLLSTEAGGRTTAVRGVYRPNHNFFEPDNPEMAIGTIELPTGEELSPGETRTLPITFIAWPPLAQITPGRQWRIQEGHRLVGIGIVKEVQG